MRSPVQAVVPFLLALSLGCKTAPIVPGEGHRDVEFVPEELLYRPYVADPRRPTFGVVGMTATDNTIPDTGDARYGIRMGTRFGILRYGKMDREDGAFQLDGEIGFLGWFDQENSTDNIGWDGFYSLLATWRASHFVALQFGMKHDSAHLGDEYVESTGRTRLDYTREEFVVGAQFDLNPVWRIYGEYGHGYNLRNEDLQEEGRMQGGVEFETRPVFFGERSAPYGALDLNAYEEDDWDPNVVFQTGLVTRTEGGRTWRVGLELVEGRSPLGEFFQADEQSVALGVWFDL